MHLSYILYGSDEYEEAKTFIAWLHEFIRTKNSQHKTSVHRA